MVMSLFYLYKPSLMLDFTLLSKYRTQLMGVAIVIIVFAHSKIETSLSIVNFMKFIGYGGVDMFLMLSGIGIYFSLNSDNDVIAFYKRRVLRILPYTIPITLCFSLYFEDNFVDVLYNVTSLSFWLNTSGAIWNAGYDWYIPSLLVMYLFSPFYLKLFDKNPRIITIISCCVVLMVAYLISNTDYAYLLVFITRIPIFLIGILTGYYVQKDIRISYKTFAFLLFCFLVGICFLVLNKYYFQPMTLWLYGLWWYPFILITLPLLLILSMILAQFKNYQYPILSFFGKYSLVIFLLHEKLLSVMSNIGFTSSLILLNTLAIFLTLVIGYFYQNLVQKIIAKF